MKKVVLSFLFTAIILITSALFADPITIHNKTNRDLHVAMYYIGTKWNLMEQPNGTIATPIYLIKSQSSITMERPPRRTKVEKGSNMKGPGPFDQQLIFFENKDLLTPELTPEQALNPFNSLNIGNLQGKVFYIGQLNGMLQGFNCTDWKANGKKCEENDKRGKK